MQDKPSYLDKLNLNEINIIPSNKKKRHKMNKLNENKISIFVKTNHQDFLKNKKQKNLQEIK